MTRLFDWAFTHPEAFYIALGYAIFTVAFWLGAAAQAWFSGRK